VHLPGKTDARNILTVQSRGRERFPHGNAAGAPPIFGALFGPADTRRSERGMIFGGGCGD